MRKLDLVGQRPEARGRISAIFLPFLHGAAVTIIFVLFLNATYEDEVYDQVLNASITNRMSDQERVLSLLHVTHDLLKPRHVIFGGQNHVNLRDTLFRSADVQMLDAREACGSYTHVLGRLLQRAGYDIRIAQMKCGAIWGCHIVLEVKLFGRWVVLDAIYNMAFWRRDGELASIADVRRDWEYYKEKLPENYDPSYSYEEVRYTNWQKIPLIMAGLKEGLRLVLGDDVETLSIRPHMLNLYKAYGVAASAVYALLVALSAMMLMRRRRS